MLFHLHGVQVVQGKLADPGDADRELATEVGLFGLEVDGFVDLLRGKDIVSNRDVVHKDRFQFVGLGTKNLVLLKSFKVVNGQVADNWLGAVYGHFGLRLFEAKFGHLLGQVSGGRGHFWVGGHLCLELDRLAIDEVDSVSVDDTVTRTLNFKVVGNQVNGASGYERVLGPLRLVAEATGVSTRRVAASSFWNTG